MPRIPDHISVIHLALPEREDVMYECVTLMRADRSAAPWEYGEQTAGADGIAEFKTIACGLSDVDALIRLLPHIPAIPGGTQLTIYPEEV